VSRLDVLLRTHRVDKRQVGLRVLFDEAEALLAQRLRAVDRAGCSIPLLSGKACRLLNQGRRRRDDRCTR
jgi:hypothetical protein